MSNSATEWLDQVAKTQRDAIEAGATPNGEETTARQLLNRFGYARRGRWVIAEIRNALNERQLRTSPDFEFEWVDNPLLITLEDNGERLGGRKAVDPTVRIGMLPAAHNKPVSVKRDDSLVKATTIMRIEDYSQLPVMPNPHTVKGVVSWKSIGAAHAEGRTPTKVRECMGEPCIVDIQMTLGDATDLIHEHEYVLVKGSNKKIGGIVTAADLALQFKQLTYPFLLIGEIEHHLRNLIRGKFSVEELVEASGGDPEVRGPDDLTFGGYCRLLQKKAAWTKLNVNVDRAEFNERLDLMRQIRNDIMHFTPEPRDALEIRGLECMARFCRTLTSYGR